MVLEENLLKNTVLVADKLSHPFSALGKTYRIDKPEISGYCWYYETEDFIINIYDFRIHETTLIHFDKNNSSAGHISVSFIKSAYGECLAPHYYTLANNSIFANVFNAKAAQFLLHSGFPYFSVGVVFKKHFIEEYIPAHFHVKTDDIKNALYFLNSIDNIPQLSQVADEILAFGDSNPGAELFYEVKAKELLSTTLNYYFNYQLEASYRSADDNEALERLCRYIDDHYASHLPQELLCKIALMGKTKLKHSFKSKYRMTITEYIQRRRISVAEHMLITSQLNIKEISQFVGYNSHGRFSALFTKYKGMQPKDFRKYVEKEKS